MNTKTQATPAAVLIALGVLAGCSDDDPAPDKQATTRSQDAPSSGRELADWAATTFLDQESTDICDVGTESLISRFAKEGWCEQDVSFKQTPVSLDLIATCDATQTPDRTSPGTLYGYHVDPTIDFTGSGSTDGGIIVIVAEQDDAWLISDLYTTSLDPADPVIGSCPYGGMQLLDESISLD